MAPENTETMRKGNEVSNGCFQGKNLYYGPPGPRCNNGYKLGLNHAGAGKQADADSEAINSDKLMVSGVCYGRPVQHENCYFWSPYSYPYDGCYYSSNNGLYYPTHGYSQVPMQMLPQSYPPEYSLQDFQYFVVIDFEATCDKEKNPHPQEIIEFPSVLVNSRTGQLEDSFQIYVRPTYNKQLTEFCKELTGINQSQVDEGVLLSEALLMHDKWLEDKGIKHTNFTVVTWSNWDCRVMLESECRFKKIRKPPYFNRWINLKVPFGEVYGGSRCNLREAVELSGLKWEGRAHCGLDDAKNTARLLTHLMHYGIKLSITNSLLWQSADHPHALQQPVPSLPEYGFPYQTHKWENLAYCTAMPFAKNVKDPPLRCYCGATSIKFLKPGPKRGSLCFFGCGNWTANGGARCLFLKWVPSADSTEAASAQGRLK